MIVMSTRFLVLLAVFLCVQTCRAEPGESCQISSDCDPGERCKLGICGPRQLQNNSPNDANRGQRAFPQPPAQQLNFGTICCDQFRNSRCQINNGPQPIGSGCFCFGQGYGFVCR